MVNLIFILDSVLMYGAYSNYSKEKRPYVTRKFQFQIKFHRARCWRAGGDSRLNLLPPAVGAHPPPFGRSLDRQTVKARTLSPHFYRVGTGCYVIRVAAYFTARR